MDESLFSDRVKVKNFDTLLSTIIGFYNITDFISYKFITTGYEDCNIKILCKKSVYLLKIFSKDRDLPEINRYISIIQEVVRLGVSHPRLFPSIRNNYLEEIKDGNSDVQFILMEYIEGNTFFELNRLPTSEELDEIIYQVSLLHSSDFKPEYTYDSWAILNIKDKYLEVKEYLSLDERNKCDEIIEKIQEIDLKKLHYNFVHGDLIKTNIIRSLTGRIFIIDFSVSNFYPRIIELAVMIASLMGGENSTQNLDERISTMINKYEKYFILTEYEKQALRIFSWGAIAMEFIGASKEKYINHNSTTENDYWYELGKEGIFSVR